MTHTRDASSPSPIRRTRAVDLQVGHRRWSRADRRFLIVRPSAGLVSCADHASRQRRGRPTQTGHRVARHRGRPSPFPTNRPPWPAPGYSPNEDITLHAQLGDLLAALVELGALVDREPFLLAPLNAVLVHPVPKRAHMDPQIPGHLSDRLARLPHNPDRPLTGTRDRTSVVSLGITTPHRGCLHTSGGCPVAPEGRRSARPACHLIEDRNNLGAAWSLQGRSRTPTAGVWWHVFSCAKPSVAVARARLHRARQAGCACSGFVGA